jgi:hypothetical protein
MTHRFSHRLVPAAALLAAVVLASLLAACERDGGDRLKGMPEVTPPENMADVRNFSRAELDTLRAMKNRNHVTRDEYWDDRGGVLANEWLEVWYPPGKLTVSHGMFVLNSIMQCHPVVEDLFGGVPLGRLTVVCTQTMEAYKEFTGHDWWHYSYIESDRIIYQPIHVLAARGLLDIAVPREFYEWAVMRIGGPNTPQWVRNGLASRLAEEGAILADNLSEFPDEEVKRPDGEIESALTDRDNKMLTRLAFYDAYRMVQRLDLEQGREKLAAMVVALGEGKNLDEASQSAYGMSYEELLAFARNWAPPERTSEE